MTYNKSEKNFKKEVKNERTHNVVGVPTGAVITGASVAEITIARNPNAVRAQIFAILIMVLLHSYVKTADEIHWEFIPVIPKNNMRSTPAETTRNSRKSK